MSEHKNKAKILTFLAEIFKEPLTETRLKAYLGALKDLSLDEFKMAFDHFSQCGKTNKMPFPGQIRAVARPKLPAKQEAIRILDQIEQAVRAHGYTNPKRAQESLGEQVWAIVGRFGGWRVLCHGKKIIGAQEYAQARDQIEAIITCQQQGINYNALPHAQNPKMIQNKKKILGLTQNVLKDIPNE